MRQTLILIIIFILFVIGTTIMFPLLGYTIVMLWICKKSFRSTIFPVINFHPGNKTNLDTHNSLYSFCYWHYNQVSTLGYMILMLWICKKIFFFPPFSLQSKFIREMKQTWTLVIISILSVIGTAVMFSAF